MSQTNGHRAHAAPASRAEPPPPPPAPRATACRVHSRDVAAHQELLKQVLDALTLPAPELTAEATAERDRVLGQRVAVVTGFLAELTTTPDPDADDLRVQTLAMAEMVETVPAGYERRAD